MQRQAETYAEAVAFAVRHWAGRSDGEMKVEEMQSLAQLTASLVPFEGSGGVLCCPSLFLVIFSVTTLLSWGNPVPVLEVLSACSGQQGP